MKCFYCNSELPSKANFCPKCLRQIACLNCKESLVKDTSICVCCGKLITQNNSVNTAVNTVEFSENETGRTFKATFTDSTAGNVVETIANLLPFQKQPNHKELSVANVAKERTVEDIESVEVVSEQKPKSNDLATLERIFRHKDNKITIYEFRLKQQTRRDFVARVTLLYLYYQEQLGNMEIARKDLNSFLDVKKLNDSNFRKWLSENKKLINNDNDLLSLSQEGKDRAIQILTEFTDSSISTVWEFTSGSTGKNKKDDTKSIVNGKSKNKTNTTTYKIVSELNLKPNNKKALTDFYAEYSVKKAAAEHNLFFVYYLERILGEKNITINHVYTCYKDVKKQFPNNLYQSLQDTKKLHGWINTKSMTDLKITTAGENHFEHNMAKK